VRQSSRTDAGVYTFRLSNTAATVLSQPFSVEVQDDSLLFQTAVTNLKAGQSSKLNLKSLDRNGIGFDNFDIKPSENRINSTVVGAELVITPPKDALGITEIIDVEIYTKGGTLLGSGKVTASVPATTPPAITTHPNAVGVPAGSIAELSVLASGGKLSYQWRQNGLAIQGANAPVLAIKASAGTYDCVVSNEAGSVTSAPATISIVDPPVFTEQPVSLTGLNVGSGASLWISIQSSVPVSFQWFKDGTALLGQNERVLTLAGIVPSDEGTYHVVATNSYGVSAKSNPAAIALSDATIRIIAQPLSQDVFEKTPVSIQVVARGPQETKAPLSYKWIEKLADGTERPIGTNSKTLTLPSSQTAIGGSSSTFLCEVSSSLAPSIRSVPATIKVLKSEFSLDETRLVNQEVSQLDSVSFSISVSGEGPFRYQWLKNGTEIDSPAARRDTLLIPQAAESDEGTYSVKVSRGASSITSKRSARLVVLAPITVVKQPVLSNSQIFEGQSITLTAKASIAGASYQWRKGGTALPSATKDSLTLKGVKVSDSGTYDVVVTDQQGDVVRSRAVSAAVLLQVRDFVTITGQPSSLVSNPGDGIALEVRTTGGSPSFQWFFKDSVIPGEISPRLSIPKVATKDEGVYHVRITSPGQTEIRSSPATIRLNRPVEITRNLSTSPITLTQGSALTLQVAAVGTAPVVYQWRKDGIPLANATSQRLIISNVSPSNAGFYDCMISNIVGPVFSQSTSVTVQESLRIGTQPQAMTNLNPGEIFSAGFTLIGATGTEKVQWYRTAGKTTEPVVGASATTLAIPQVQVSDGGLYFAVITRGPTKITSNVANLVVNKPVSFTTEPADQAVFEGKDVILSSQVSGTSTKAVPITYQWFKNNEIIPGARSSSLTIGKARISDSGDYSVTVQNVVGKVISRAAKLTVKPAATYSAIYAIVNGTKRSPAKQITENPSSLDKPVKFKLAVDVVASDFQVEYQWRVNGRKILAPSATSASLDFDSLGRAEGGVYDVIISTKLDGLLVDERTLDSVYVTVNEPVSIQKIPASQGVNSGSKVVFSTEATGTGLTYQWSKWSSTAKSYIDLPNETKSSLTLVSGPSTEGRYKVKFSGTTNQPELSEIKLWTIDSIRIRKQPEALTVKPGQTAKLTVDAIRADSSKSPLYYRWRKDSGVMGLSNGSLTSINVDQSGSGYVAAPRVTIVANGAGAGATAEAIVVPDASGETLSVAAIQITNPGSGYTAAPEIKIEGEIARNKEGTIGLPASASVFFRPTVTTSPDLLLSEVSESDEGEYFVEIFDQPVQDDAARLTSARIKLTVNTPAKIDLQPTSLLAVETKPFSVNLTSRGTNATYVWSKLSSSEPRTFSVFRQTTSNSLTFPSISEADAGVYRVEVKTDSPKASVVSDDISLAVVAIPKEIGAPLTLVEKDPLESFRIEPRISTPPAGQTFYFQWFKNDVEIPGAFGRNLFINQASESDEGVYRIEAYSEAGVLKAKPITLQVNDVPRVVSSPSNVTVNPNQPFDLSVTALGKDLTYQWYLNGVAISGAKSSTYKVAQAVNKDTEGTYSVVISSSTRYGGTGTPLQVTAKATVNVNDPTEIIRQPSSEPVSGINLGGSRVWTVNAAGSNLRYQWQKNGTDLPGQTDKSLRLTDAKKQDEGLYRVNITGALGAATSQDFVLEINRAPVLRSQPKPVSFLAGARIEIPSDVDGSAPLSYQWRKDGRPIQNQTGKSLIITASSPEDAGLYDVTVSNPVGNVRSSTIRVDLIDPVEILAQPTSVIAIPGENPVFNVNATGGGTVTYQWFKDGEPLANQTLSYLKLASVKTTDQGRYSVVVSNPAGDAYSQVAKLTVLSPVLISKQPENVRAIAGAKTQFEVTVSEDSLPVSYQWRKNGTAIPDETDSALVLSGVSSTDQADYDVVITNAVGSVTSTTASLVIETKLSPPKLPSNLTVAQGSGTAIIVSPTGTGPFSFQWRKDGQPIQGATDDTLIIEFTSVSDVGSYDVVVSNPSSSVTSTSTSLKVDARITVDAQPEDASLPVGSSAKFSVSARTTRSNATLLYQWRRNGVPIANATSPTLSVTATQSTQGVYDVKITEQIGTAAGYFIFSRGAALDLFQPVKIVSPLKDLTVYEGDGAGFEVLASASSPITYSWSLNGKPIVGQSGNRLVLPTVKSGSLSADTYSVSVSDGKSSASSSAKLTVLVRAASEKPAVSKPKVTASSATKRARKIRVYSVEARPVANAAPFEGSVYLDAITESAVVSESTARVISTVRLPANGVTHAPAAVSSQTEGLRLRFQSDMGTESWNLQGPATTVSADSASGWMAHSLVGLRTVHDARGKLLGTWMVTLRFEEVIPSLPTTGSPANK
jgi:hypothetical protein